MIANVGEKLLLSNIHNRDTIHLAKGCVIAKCNFTLLIGHLYVFQRNMKNNFKKVSTFIKYLSDFLCQLLVFMEVQLGRNSCTRSTLDVRER